jgi:hypothetical protein
LFGVGFVVPADPLLSGVVLAPLPEEPLPLVPLVPDDPFVFGVAGAGLVVLLFGGLAGVFGVADGGLVVLSLGFVGVAGVAGAIDPLLPVALLPVVPLVPLVPLVPPDVSPVPGVAGVVAVVVVVSLRWQAPSVRPSSAAPSASFDAFENAFMFAPRSRQCVAAACPRDRWGWAATPFSPAMGLLVRPIDGTIREAARTSTRSRSVHEFDCENLDWGRGRQFGVMRHRRVFGARCACNLTRLKRRSRHV